MVNLSAGQTLKPALNVGTWWSYVATWQALVIVGRHSSFAKSPLHTLGTILQLSERAENASLNHNAPMQAADYVPYDLGYEGLWYAAVDRELAHAVSQSSALKTKSVGGPIRASDDPVRRMQHMKNVFSLHGFQR
jgi:hypothetical protein